MSGCRTQFFSKSFKSLNFKNRMLCKSTERLFFLNAWIVLYLLYSNLFFNSPTFFSSLTGILVVNLLFVSFSFCLLVRTFIYHFLFEWNGWKRFFTETKMVIVFASRLSTAASGAIGNSIPNTFSILNFLWIFRFELL